VPGQDGRTRVGELGNIAREPEAWTAVGHNCHIVAESGLHVALAFRGVCQHAYGVGMRVVDMPCWQKRVQQRLDGGVARSGLDHAAREIRDHILI
jgi:hypothetical protein